MEASFADPSESSVPIWLVSPESWPSIRERLSGEARSFADALGFSAEKGRHIYLPDSNGALAAVLFAYGAATDSEVDAFCFGGLVNQLPAGVYRLANDPAPGSGVTLERCALSWTLSSYRYTHFKSKKESMPRLVAPAGVDAGRIEAISLAMIHGRDLINTPANELGPGALEAAALTLAGRFGADARVIKGEALLRDNFPLIHAVGKAAEEEPRLVEFLWGPADALKVTLVGKGVCFDSGGLDIKPASAMNLMKKDMAGAAVALTISEMAMRRALPIRLRVLLPIVENAISSQSFRPGDVYRSRQGATVEIGNTDAEGRLILADCLAYAEEERPDFLFNFATLTGAARVALGPDLPAFFTPDDKLAEQLIAAGAAAIDPVWRLPLWKPYDSMIDSKIASMNNVSSSPFAGSIIAALFLARFVSPGRAWAHFDLYGWNPSTRPGRPEGGEAQTARLIFHFLEQCAAPK